MADQFSGPISPRMRLCSLAERRQPPAGLPLLVAKLGPQASHSQQKKRTAFPPVSAMLARSPRAECGRRLRENSGRILADLADVSRSLFAEHPAGYARVWPAAPSRRPAGCGSVCSCNRRQRSIGEWVNRLATGRRFCCGVGVGVREIFAGVASAGCVRSPRIVNRLTFAPACPAA